MKYCHQCGHPNDEQAQYCERDGVLLESMDTSYKFEMNNGEYCTSCGSAREAHHVYCRTCGHHTLEPRIGINRVEESLKSVAATGSQVLSQLKRATTTGQLPDYKQALQRLSIRPDASNLVRGAVFGIVFLAVVSLFAALLVSYIPYEIRSGLTEVFGSEASTFKIFSLIAVILLTNLYWSLNVENLLSVTDELDSESLSFLSQYPMMLDGRLGNYFFAFGGVLLVMGLGFLLFRNAKSLQEGWGRFVGMFLALIIGHVFLSLFAMDLTFIESNWILNTLTTWFSFALAIGLGALLSVRLNGIWKAAQQGGRAIITVTILTTLIGGTYLGYQLMKVNELSSDMMGYYSGLESTKVPVGQGLIANWQIVGHGGTQKLEMQSPILSLSIGSSPFGSATPKEIETSVSQLGDGLSDLEYMIEDMVEYGEFPRESYAVTKELPTLSTSFVGLVRQAAEASYAQDDEKLERLYNEGIFSWFKVLVFLNILIYAAFAYRTVLSKEQLAAFVVAPFLIYLIWQWFLGGGMTFAVGKREVFEVSIHNFSFMGVLITLAVMTAGGTIGWLLNRKRNIHS
ncbi:zinc ribbon domain-containing protein [Exiguobacterium sp. TRN 1102]|uniref:zinc ribbon domain-containing protein n=1 Tax=Exiguobacterium sp. TRN 1102 TaxID=3420732 RepID=UPI003D77AFDE